MSTLETRSGDTGEEETKATEDMSVSLSAERDRIQRQVEELEQSLSATHNELELLSSETDDDSEESTKQSAAGLLAEREKIQNEIQNLESVLGPHSPLCVSDEEDSSSEESELGLSPSADSCLQMNLVYQQVVQETLDQLETLLTHNHKQQKELVSQLSGPIKEPNRERPAPSSCQQPITMYLGRFLKPYFKDKLTGLGPPANQETKEKASRMTGCLDDKKLKIKRWESWQKTLLIHSVTRDSLRRLIQPKLSKVDYLSLKLSRAPETEREQLRQQIDSLERDIDLIRGKNEKELIGDRYDEHDWQKISNIDFEGTREAEDIRSFWQNFLHPSVTKTQWSKEEVQQLKEVSRRHGERHWEAIAAELGTGRTAFLCLQTFQRFVSDSLKRGPWTPEEDAVLRELVDKMRIGNFIPYTQMSYFMEGRDPAQLIYRWNQVLDPSLKKGYWTKEEDQLLLQAVSRHGEKDWWKIRFEVPGRTDSGCRDRYYDCLKVETKRGPFDQQERELLLQLVEKHGVGRWAKIAAEIPHRYDAQCLREWRKLSKPARRPPAKKDNTTKKSPRSRGGPKKKKQACPARKKIRRRLMKLKEEEEEEEEESSEEEGMVVEYIDSDEEEKKEVEEVEIIEKEEEEEYTFPPMQEWIPIEKAQCFTFLSFRPVELPSSGEAHNQLHVRSTILGQFGRSVIVGPNPKELQWEGRHRSSTMMMVSPDQLRAHLHHQVHKFNNRSYGPRKKVRTEKQSPMGRVTDMGLCYELQAAVTPWIGNLLIPTKTRLTTADALRQQGEKTKLPSTPVFLLLLQAMNVDTMGCKEMIEQRKNRVVSLTPPPPPPPRPSSARKNTVAELLQRRKAMKDELEMFNQQHNQILKQLKVLQKQELQPPPHPLPRLPSMPSQNRPGILLQMPPNMHPQMSPMSFPRAVFIPNPVRQPQASSIQLISPSLQNMPLPVPCRPPPVAGVTSPLPAHPAPHRLIGPPAFVIPAPLNTTSTCSASLHQEAVPVTQTLTLALPPSTNQQVTIGSTLPNQHAAPSTSSSPSTGPTISPSDSTSARGRGQMVADHHQAVCSSQSGVDVDGAGNGAGNGAGAGTAVDEAVDSVITGRRICNLSQKTRALQEATDTKAEAKESSPHKRTGIQTISPGPPETSIPGPSQTVALGPPQTVIPNPSQTVAPGPPQTVALGPPQTVAPGPPQTVAPGPPQTVALGPPQTVIPGPSQTVAPGPPQTVALGPPQTVALGPPQTVAPVPPQTVIPGPPQIVAFCIPTNKQTASSSSRLPAPFPNDHDYTSFKLHPSQHGSDSIQLTQDSTPNNPSKAPPSRRKRRRQEEQPTVTGSHNDQYVGGTGDAVSGTGVIQKGKRVRNPTQRAKALQEATQAKAEAKKKRISSSPCKKRSRTSQPKKEVVVQNQPVTQLPGFCLNPGQSMWIMTPRGLVQLAEAPPQGLQLALVPSATLPAPPRNNLNHQLVTPPLQLTAGSPRPITARPTAAVRVPILNQPLPLPAQTTCASKPLTPAFTLQHVSNPCSSPQPPPKLIQQYKRMVRVDKASAPPLRREALQFDPSLMFLESQEAVHDWLSGRRGVVVPGAGVALPYLPPFVSTLSTLSALLRAKKSLTTSSLQLLSRGSAPRRPQTTPMPDGSPERRSSQPPDLPDSTSDLRPAQDTPDTAAPSVNYDLLQEEEAELVVVARQLVAERFSGNPAYQLLKARFLSCFTVPALLATMQPTVEKTVGGPANEEEEVEKEAEELKKIKERGRQRRAERSLLLCDGSGAPANHFSGINTNTAGLDQTCPAKAHV